MIGQPRPPERNYFDNLMLNNDRKLKIFGRFMLGAAALNLTAGALWLHADLQDREDKAGLIADYSQYQELNQPEVQAEIAGVQTNIDTDNDYLKRSVIGLLSGLITVGGIAALRIKNQDMASQTPSEQDTPPETSFVSIQLPL